MPRPALLPRMSLFLLCEECGALVREYDVNTTRLVSAVATARREHAQAEHDWQPPSARGAPGLAADR